MKKQTLIGGLLAVLGFGGLLLDATPSMAADHLDGPRSSGDPAADITDVYAFMSPTNKTHAVFVMNVTPKATTSSLLSDAVKYSFRIKPVTATTPSITLGDSEDIVCTSASSSTMITCAGGKTPTSVSKTVTFGTTGTCAATDNICVFAGLRSDPFFFDLNAFNASGTMNMNKFTSPGSNFFMGLNVISIVVEVDVATAFGTAGAMAVAAETNRM
jgi:hypothetical protein